MNKILILLILIFLIELITCITDIYKCNEALGMQTGLIDDRQITSSSSINNVTLGAHNARIIKHDTNTGRSTSLNAWCPLNEITLQSYEYLQINLKSLHIITRIETQGRGGFTNEYTENYRLEYTRDLNELSATWIRYKDRDGSQIFKGNADSFTSEIRFLNKPLIARYIRIIPVSKLKRNVCLRVELYGCQFEDDIVSYEIRNGDYKHNDQANYKDLTYDGKEVFINNKSYLQGGLGQLTDGEFGDLDEDSHKKERYGIKGYDWIGWRNTSDYDTVRIFFNFDNIRNFTMCSIYVFNNADTRIEQFSRARLRFSIDGGASFKDEITYLPQRDLTIGLPRPIFINLSGKQGNTVLIELEFYSKWLLISEITFESKKAYDNDNQQYLLSTQEPRTNHFIDQTNSSPQSIHFTFQTLVILLIALLTILIVILVFIIFMLIRSKKRTKYKAKYHQESSSLKPPSVCEMLCCCCLTGNKRNASQTIDNYLKYNECQTLKTNLTGTNSSTTTTTNSSTIPISTADAISTYPTLKLNEFNFIPNPNQIEFNSFLIANTLQKNRYMPNSGQSSSLTTPLLVPNVTSISDQAQVYLDHEYQLNEIHYAATEVNSSTTQQHPQQAMIKLIPIKNYFPTTTSISGGNNGGTANIYYTIKPQNQFNTLKSNYLNCNTIQKMIINEKLQQLNKIDPQSISFLSKIGESSVSNFYIGQINTLDTLQKLPKIENVLIKVLKNEHDKSIKCAFDNDIDLTIINKQSNETNPNIIRLLGYCDNPYCFIIESYSSSINLYQYLIKQQDQQFENETQVSCLNYSNIINISLQISQAMLYLESIQQIHKDLSTKNCIIYLNKLNNEFHIKICDLARYMYSYKDDYCVLLTNTQQSIRLRWSSIETILNGKFTHKSDVWSFATLLYELQTGCLKRPYDEFNDEQLIQFINQQNNLNQEQLVDILVNSSLKPKLIDTYTKELYDLMYQCWCLNDYDRPSFKDINLFLSYQLNGNNC